MNHVRRSLPRRGCALLAAALVLLSLLMPMAQAAPERETIRVGFFAFDGYHEIDERGTRSGYGYDFLRMVARYLDVEYEYIGYELGWDAMPDLLAAGEIDMVTSAQVTPERLAEFAFSKAIGSSSAMLTVDSENRAIAPGVYRTYDGIRIGLLEGNSRNEDLERFAADNGFTYTPVYFSLYTELEQALQSGQVDAACTSSLRQIEGERVLDYFAVEQFYALLRKEDTALLERINYAIDQMDAVEGDWKNDLNNKYYFHQEERELAFTAEELALLHQYASGEQKLVVSVCTDKKPYAYEENGEAKGILIDYFALLADYVGVPYEIAVPADRQEYMRWCEEENVANVFLDGRFANIYQAESKGKAITTPYTTMSLAMVTRRDFSGSIDTLAVSTAQGLFGIEDGLAPGAKRLETASREEAMQAVLEGRADATFAYLSTAQQFVNQDERGLLTYTLLDEPTYEYRVSFASNVSNTLAGIFTKAIFAMQEGALESIAAEYTSYKAENINLNTWIKIYPLPAILICTVVFVACLLAVLLIERQKAIRLEKKRSAQLQELADQAERANRAKSDFLADVSHDIRTPMNAIIGFANLMENEMDDPARMREHLQKIKFSGHHLLCLINDVLDMSRIEANQVVLLPEPVSLSAQLRQVESIARCEAEEREQTFEVCIHPLTHDTVIADGTRLRQVLLNLLSNAVKYTPRGGTVTLDAQELPCEVGGSARFRFTVADNGCGMTQEFVEHIFEPFVRSEASVTNKIQGTGLGMPITKNLVDVMGGEIRVDSTPGEGSRFEVTLTLPAAPAGQGTAESEEHSTLRGMRFLCAEDNELNAEILTATLNLYGAQCVICPDGAQLLETFRAAEPDRYDAILMDIQMPVMNGLEAARALRAGGYSIPIIAMTANAFEQDVRQCMDAGMNAHISKPISIEALEKAAAQLCRRAAE